MISILIPTFNHDCSDLVHALLQQAEAMQLTIEIIVGDDCSTHATIADALHELNKLPHCHTFRVAHNVGRAAMRNLLARKAQHPYLLYIDSDAALCSDHFLARYQAQLPIKGAVCGGIIHPDTLPHKAVSLRYYYEKEAEHRFTASRRMQHPYAYFRTFNFLITKDAIQQCPFDESFQGYGYEDVLLGHQLQQSHLPVIHIDNALLNTDLEPNDIFLQKTEEALHTAAQHKIDLARHVKVLRMALCIKKCGLLPVTKLLAGSVLSRMRKRLASSSRPSLKLFALYKLLYLCKIL